VGGGAPSGGGLIRGGPGSVAAEGLLQERGIKGEQRKTKRAIKFKNYLMNSMTLQGDLEKWHLLGSFDRLMGRRLVGEVERTKVQEWRAKKRADAPFIRKRSQKKRTKTPEPARGRC